MVTRVQRRTTLAIARGFHVPVPADDHLGVGNIDGIDGAVSLCRSVAGATPSTGQRHRDVNIDNGGLSVIFPVVTTFTMAPTEAYVGVDRLQQPCS